MKDVLNGTKNLSFEENFESDDSSPVYRLVGLSSAVPFRRPPMVAQEQTNGTHVGA
jgi:hypothetical protein